MPLDLLPYRSIVVASSDDPFIGIARAQELAEAWGADFIHAGAVGHINVDAGFGHWPEGEALLRELIDEQRHHHRRRGDRLGNPGAFDSDVRRRSGDQMWYISATLLPSAHRDHVGQRQPIQNFRHRVADLGHGDAHRAGLHIVAVVAGLIGGAGTAGDRREGAVEGTDGEADFDLARGSGQRITPTGALLAVDDAGVERSPRMASRNFFGILWVSAMSIAWVVFPGSRVARCARALSPYFPLAVSIFLDRARWSG